LALCALEAPALGQMPSPPAETDLLEFLAGASEAGGTTGPDAIAESKPSP
ncbi:MAG: hypothetical protein HC824_15815, partial [Synechococcales cyanobacterium RM1_1_8]|nr:hypothetical protein [Synechococcales cyanobacterium RM1_1_8]